MKILCDDCGKEEASVFCAADEAALCDGCDRRVHCANKLASKHNRFKLISSFNSDKSPTICDICREKHAFLFCQEDRAILCIECNTSIHGANHLTMKHNRFVLTGVRLSSIHASYPETTTTDKRIAQPNSSTMSKIEPIKITSTNMPKPNQIKITSTNKSTITTSTATTTFNNPNATTNHENASISEYLTKMCPGWHVEDLLVEEDLNSNLSGFSKVDELLPFFETDLGVGDLRPPAELPVWAPHVPKFTPQVRSTPAIAGNMEVSIGYQNGGIKVGRQQRSEDVFMVPQIPSPVSNSSKRARHSIWY